MDTDQCPKCDAKTVVAGRFQGMEQRGKFFEPTGMRFFNFRLSGRGVSCPGPVRACLKCGHVWTQLEPEDLRTFIDKHGSVDTKHKLSPFRKAPPEQDLV
jgi:hypothetical protein